MRIYIDDHGRILCEKHKLQVSMNCRIPFLFFNVYTYICIYFQCVEKEVQRATHQTSGHS